jgi:hypothetical protein
MVAACMNCQQAVRHAQDSGEEGFDRQTLSSPSCGMVKSSDGTSHCSQHTVIMDVCRYKETWPERACLHIRQTTAIRLSLFRRPLAPGRSRLTVQNHATLPGGKTAIVVMQCDCMQVRQEPFGQARLQSVPRSESFDRGMGFKQVIPQVSRYQCQNGRVGLQRCR